MSSVDVGERVEALLEQLRQQGGDGATATGEELVRVVMGYYAEGLEAIVGALDEQVVRTLATDPLIESLLVLHGLHPSSVDERIEAALDRVRPYLGSHAGGVAYLGVGEDGVAHLRLDGSCNGCASSSITVQATIEEAVMAAAPELSGIDVAGQTERARPLLQIGTRPGAPAAGPTPEPSIEWHHPRATDLPIDGLTSFGDVGGVSVFFARLDGALYAYRDECASCSASLAGAALDGDVATCPSCGSRFDVRLAGRSPDGTGRHLAPIPLLDDTSGIRLAIPAVHRQRAGV